MVLARTRRRRSEKLTPEEFASLKEYVASFDTKIDAFEAIGITKPTLNIILIRGTGSTETVEKIRAALKKKNQHK